MAKPEAESEIVYSAQVHRLCALIVIVSVVCLVAYVFIPTRYASMLSCHLDNTHDCLEMFDE